MGKPKRKKPLGRPRHCGDDNTRITQCILNKYDRGVEWIYLGQGRVKWRTLVNTVMNFRIP